MGEGAGSSPSYGFLRWLEYMSCNPTCLGAVATDWHWHAVTRLAFGVDGGSSGVLAYDYSDAW